MRTQQQMMELILGIARTDPRIRAVWMNGSRTNPHVPRDIFQDYDIVYAVTDVQGYVDDRNWIDVFGERIVMQRPDESVLFDEKPSPLRYAYLMQFADGNRIDLTLLDLSIARREVLSDKLTVVLLDKDSLLPPVPPPSDEDYRVKKPDAAHFSDCCNEFWWVMPYAAKGLWRREILFAKEHMEQNIRPMLLMMLGWEVGVLTGFTVSVGKCGKYLDKYLPKERWEGLLRTYSAADYPSVWDALLEMGELFHVSACKVAQECGFSYPYEDDCRVMAHLRHVRQLPSTATEIYPS